MSGGLTLQRGESPGSQARTFDRAEGYKQVRPAPEQVSTRETETVCTDADPSGRGGGPNDLGRVLWEEWREGGVKRCATTMALPRIKSSQRAAEKIYSPSRERDQYFSSQKEATTIFHRNYVFA